jgi:5-methyltetrahydrofolate corrinoid/iron sulfur protein methyltransferase
VWLIETIQGSGDTPLSLDSANPKALQVAIQAVKKTPMINSISGEPDRLANILPIVAEHGCPVIALAMDEKKIPETADKRFEVITKIRARGARPRHARLEPVFRPAGNDAFDQRPERNDRLRYHAPACAGVPRSAPDHRPEQYFLWAARTLVHQPLFPGAGNPGGLDSAILDPLDREIQAAILATELVLGRDRHCLNYIRASRKGLFDKPEKSRSAFISWLS